MRLPIAAASYPSGAPKSVTVRGRCLSERARSASIVIEGGNPSRRENRISSPPRKWGSRSPRRGAGWPWTPAFAGMTSNRRWGRSCCGGSPAEGNEEAGHVVIVFGRRNDAAGHPFEDVGIGAVEQSLVAVELSHVKAGQM